MMILEMTLFGDPVSKGRPRMGPSGHAYTPERTRAAERAATAQFQERLNGQPPATVRVGLSATFYCATRRKTDLDNLTKLVTDAMNGVVVEDDSLFEEFTLRLHRGVGKANAKTEIMVYELM